MNRRVFVLAATALACQAASAQSSVTLYGLISTGIVYANNQKGADKQGHSTWQFASGPMQTPRWGMKGVEDLGGGVKAIFTLENGYNVGNGTLSQGGREFGRQAFVGLSSDTFGAVTFGRQYDEAVTLCVFSSACQFAAYGAHIGDSDNVFDTFRINNAVQYKSIDYRGFQFEGLYGFSNKAGGFSDNNAYSAGAQYRNGPLSLGAAYLQVNNPNDVNNPNGAVVGDYGFSSPFITNPATSSGVSKQRMVWRWRRLRIGHGEPFAALYQCALRLSRQLAADFAELRGFAHRLRSPGPDARCRVYLHHGAISSAGDESEVASGECGCRLLPQQENRFVPRRHLPEGRWRCAVRADLYAFAFDHEDAGFGGDRPAPQVVIVILCSV